MNYDELINTASNVGYLLLYNGAEIYRVEESMQRIFRAYGVTTGEIFAIPSCIIATITTGQGKPVTQIRRLYLRETNLDKVECVNDLCRRICRTRPDFDGIRHELEQIDNRPIYGFWEQLLGYVLVGFAFTLFYGGNFADACCAAVCSAGLKIVCYKMNEFKANSFFTNIAASCVAAAIAWISIYAGFGVNMDKIIIGALMNLVPGIVITSFMRDVMAGDLVAGLIRFLESLLVATAIAIGAGLALIMPRLILGV